MSSSNSSHTPDQKLKTTVVAMEEKRTMNNPKQGSLEEVVFENTITEERPSFGFGVVRTETSMMKKYPPKHTTVVMCKICKKYFPNSRSLNGHQTGHKHERKLERKLKKKEPSYFPGQGFWRKPNNSYQDKSNFLFGENSQGALFDNPKHPGISFGPFKSTGGGGSSSIRRTTFPPIDNRFMVNNSHGFASGTPLPTHNYKYPNAYPILESSSSDYPTLFSGGIYKDFTGMVPPATIPYTGNSIYGSSSRVPSYSYSPHALSLDLSLGLPNPIGSRSSRNNYSSSHGLASLDLLPPGPSKSIGDSSNNTSGVTGEGVTMDLNMPLPPSVLDSITRNAPLSHDPLPPATNLSNDENVSGSSNSEKLISKGKKDMYLFGIRITE